MENARRVYPGIRVEQVRKIFGEPEVELRDNRPIGMNGFTGIWDSKKLMVSIFFDDADGGASMAIVHGVDRCVSENGVLVLFEDRSFWQRARYTLRL